MTEKAIAVQTLPAEPDITSRKATAVERFIIVGSGPVGVRMAQLILQKQPNAHIKLFGDEPVAPYNRVQLSALLFGEVSRDSIDLEMPSNTKHPKFEFYPQRVTDINRAHRTITDQRNKCHSYDHLILAVGARAHVPQIPGTQLAGVYTFRGIRDAEKLKARLTRARHIVVVGGGLLGVETARGLQKHHTQVTLIQQGTHLLNKQLDAEAAGLLAESLQALNIRIRTNAGVRAIEGHSHVSHVCIRGGERIACDTVVLCSGITPNVGLARSAKLPVSRGILVDDALQTKDPNIYAIGECAEHRGITYGLVNPGFEQAAVLADRFSNGHAAYRGSMSLSRLKLLGRSVFAFGNRSYEQANTKRSITLTYRQRKTNVYRKITLHKGRISGVIGLGDWPGFNRVQAHAEQNKRISPVQRLRFWLWGELWSANSVSDPAHWPASTLVCHCQHVSCGELTQSINRWSQQCAQQCSQQLSQQFSQQQSQQREKAKTQAPTDQGTQYNQDNPLPYIQAQTGAGTICGTCTPVIEKLCAHSGVTLKRTMVEFGYWLMGAALLAALFITILSAQAPAQQALSVSQQSWFEHIWTNKFWKQVTGFSILALCSLSLVVSLRKHLGWQWLGRFSAWRAFHGVVGSVCLALLMLHTGFHWGANLNRLLLINFVTLSGLGLAAALIISNGHRLPATLAQRLQRWSYWAHILIVWPFPVLLGLHILSVYYF